MAEKERCAKLTNNNNPEWLLNVKDLEKQSELTFNNNNNNKDSTEIDILKNNKRF